MRDYDDIWEESPDPAEERALLTLREFFNTNRETVFFSRQVEVLHEHRFFHWVTNRALRDLIDARELNSETRTLKTGGTIKLVWHRSYRYHRRAANEVVNLVEEYAHPDIGRILGWHGEDRVLEAFARNQFVLHGREQREFRGNAWTQTNHDIDFIFERDAVTYGVEVKNTLGYIDQFELQTKIRLCETLGIRPVFVVRMMPKHWIYEVASVGGFALILKYQLYHWAHKDLAQRIKQTLGLPVDAPRSIEQGTMDRFLRYHAKNM